MIEKFVGGGLVVLGVLIALGLLIALPISGSGTGYALSCSAFQPSRSGRRWACSPCFAASFRRGSNSMASPTSNGVRPRSPADIILEGVDVELDWDGTTINGIIVRDAKGNVLRIIKGEYSGMRAMVPATVEKYRLSRDTVRKSLRAGLRRET